VAMDFIGFAVNRAIWSRHERMVRQKKAENGMKLNLGCGSNHLDGWSNHDADMDITLPLPVAVNTVEAIFCEHCCEHCTPQQVWNFFEECLRVLKPGGVVRIAVPSVEKIAKHSSPAYEQAYFSRGFADSPTRKGVVKGIIFNHGHQSTWSTGVLIAYLESVGFRDVVPVEVDASNHGLERVNGHGHVIGDDFNRLETIVVEAVKP